MLDPRHIRRGGFRAFAAADHEQQIVREALADAVSDAAPPAAEPDPSATYSTTTYSTTTYPTMTYPMPSIVS